ncbi:pyridoxine 5'-phosphate synthase, partial [Desulfobacterales bacterium HSG17]|nr:pyridoxine 5'-phosphate synthase [Desulfobacterales bacterium HSG17]
METENLKAENMDSSAQPLDQLRKIVALLRSKEGCPWDRKQTQNSMAVYLLEEVYELMEAVEKGDPREILEELGDVLFHIFFMARLFSEKDLFTIDDVAAGITEKMVRRHPHVFADAKADDTKAVLRQWDQIKRTEKKSNPSDELFPGIPKKMPALMQAFQMLKRSQRNGGKTPLMRESFRAGADLFRNSDGVGEKEDMESLLGELLLAVVASAHEDKGMLVSIFIDPDVDQVKLAHKINADAVEVHTGVFCDAK